MHKTTGLICGENHVQTIYESCYDSCPLERVHSGSTRREGGDCATSTTILRICVVVYFVAIVTELVLYPASQTLSCWS